MSLTDEKIWWTVEFAEMPKFKVPEFTDDAELARYIDGIRRIGDPTIRVVAITKHVAKTTTTSETFPLGPDITKITEAVTQRFIEAHKKGASPTGASAIEWAVRATVEAMGND